MPFNYYSKAEQNCFCAYRCAKCGEMNIFPVVIEAQGSARSYSYFSGKKNEDASENARTAAQGQLEKKIEKINGGRFWLLKDSAACGKCGARAPWNSVKLLARCCTFALLAACIALFSGDLLHADFGGAGTMVIAVLLLILVFCGLYRLGMNLFSFIFGSIKALSMKRGSRECFPMLEYLPVEEGGAADERAELINAAIAEKKGSGAV